jgi:peptidylprolyl isomerase
VFGNVVEGMDVVNSITQEDAIETVSIKRVGTSAEAFDAAKIFEDEFTNFEAKQKAKEDAIVVELNKKMSEKYPNARTTESGLMIANEVEGSGEQAVAGKTVSVHYTGRLMDGTVFDSSVERGEPIDFSLGGGMVIKGWDEGVAQLKVGGKATFIIPFHLAYGERGHPPVIPAKATLEFDVELVNIK